jgi:hypothetical protein
MTNAVNIAQSGSNNVTFRNRIINGAMMVNQRNLGTTTANQSTDDTFITVDRWKVLSDQSGGSRTFTLQQSTQKPSGFSNSVLATMGGSGSLTTTSGFGFFQPIEGNNLFDLNWGTSTAQPIAVSFWINCSVTGALPLLIIIPEAGFAYYATTYTVNAANTWEYKTVTIPGSTAYGFTVNNSAAIQVMFGFGATGAREATVLNAWSNDNSGFRKGGIAGVQRLIETSGATFYVTGVQLEEGTAASPFEYRLYGQELVLCQRYFYRWDIQDMHAQTSWASVANDVSTRWVMPVTMRAKPTATVTGTFGDNSQDWSIYNNGGWRTISSFGVGTTNRNSIRMDAGLSGGINASDAVGIYCLDTDGTGGMYVSAEL